MASSVAIAAPTAQQRNVAAVDALDQPPDERGADGDKPLARIGSSLFGQHGRHYTAPTTVSV
jgi:hypothetical protein